MNAVSDFIIIEVDKGKLIKDKDKITDIAQTVKYLKDIKLDEQSAESYGKMFSIIEARMKSLLKTNPGLFEKFVKEAKESINSDPRILLNIAEILQEVYIKAIINSKLSKEILQNIEDEAEERMIQLKASRELIYEAFIFNPEEEKEEAESILELVKNFEENKISKAVFINKLEDFNKFKRISSLIVYPGFTQQGELENIIQEQLNELEIGDFSDMIEIKDGEFGGFIAIFKLIDINGVEITKETVKEMIKKQILDDLLLEDSVSIFCKSMTDSRLTDEQVRELKNNLKKYNIQNK